MSEGHRRLETDRGLALLRLSRRWLTVAKAIRAARRAAALSATALSATAQGRGCELARGQLKVAVDRSDLRRPWVAAAGTH
mgnify:CR=1 FL=1